MDVQIKSVRDKIANKDYEPKMNYPSMDDPEYRRKRKAYRAEEHRLTTIFRADLEEENGLTNYPKKDEVWNYAWEEGHSEGLDGVVNVYDELFPMLLTEMEIRAYNQKFEDLKELVGVLLKEMELSDSTYGFRFYPSKEKVMNLINN